jgi:hypothetical protein
MGGRGAFFIYFNLKRFAFLNEENIKAIVFYLDLQGGRSHFHPDVESAYVSYTLVPRNATTWRYD